MNHRRLPYLQAIHGNIELIQQLLRAAEPGLRRPRREDRFQLILNQQLTQELDLFSGKIYEQGVLVRRNMVKASTRETQ
jgi:hypothetical protein